MKSKIFLSLLLGALLAASAFGKSKLDYVNPFIGTAYHGHTFPGACAPFGLVQASPDTGGGSWRYCSGYNFEDPEILRFSQTHLSGTGCSDLGDAAIMPFSDASKAKFYKSKKANEEATAGYYKVDLPDANCSVEISAAEHSAIYRIRALEDGVKLLLDLQHGVYAAERMKAYPTLSAGVKFESKNFASGKRHSNMWVERESFFAMEFSKPILKAEEIKPAEGLEKASKYELDFGLKKGEELIVKIGISAVSEDGAKNNLKAEIPDFDFEKVKSQTRQKWLKLLSKFELDAPENTLKNFYTSVYHLFIQPNNIADVDGSYRGVDGSVRESARGKYYSTFSTWDTFRAAHSMYAILTPDAVSDFANSMLEHFASKKLLPIWTLWGKENYCMIGIHSIPVLAEAYFKGIEGFDAKRALNAMVYSSTQDRRNFDWNLYENLGYLAFDKSPCSVAITLETGYDDSCIARLAKALGDEENYKRFQRRADFYKNLFDPETHFMRGRDSAGKWRTPFNEFALPNAGGCGRDYIEGNALQYTWHVMHDVDGLIELFGGREKFAEKLSSLFKQPEKVEGAGHAADVTGLIGQYAHGNEPSHHTIYLLSLAGRQDLAAELIRKVFDSFYIPTPEGLCGNDDCGQMSAWFMFSALGFYPVDPVSCEYVLGAPQLKNAKLKLDNGKTFEVEVENFAPQNIYVKEARLNGKKLEKPIITHSDILNGGKLEFVMAPNP